MKIMQITTKKGIHVQIGVSDAAEYRAKKEAILKSTKEFVTVIDTCTICRSDVSIIEYFEKTEEPVQEVKKEKGGFKQWLRKLR
ncbi:hypothetical protein IGI37_002251 [Enterococcus sp. AZ194]|uniref:hypothetical protein n=1 Tax=Enterococcus sp. AZ194 TaxID=2774629 RepID=UPI003F22E677